MYFRYFVIVFSCWRRTWPFIWRIGISFTQLCFVPSCVEICLVLEKFTNFVNAFSLLRNYLHLENGMTLNLNKFKSPLPKDAWCQVWLKLDQWFWRRRWKFEKKTDGRQAIRAFSSGVLTINSYYKKKKYMNCSSAEKHV